MLLFSVACMKDRLTADGNVITETRNLKSFNGIYTSGAEEVHVVYGNEYKVQIKGSSNLIPKYESEVTNGKLYLNYKRVNVKNSDIEITVTLPKLKTVSLSGSAKIDIFGGFPLTDLLEIDVSGSGNILLKETLVAEVADVKISGSGDVDFIRLNCSSAKVKISGSGDVSLSVAGHLKAKISGSGNVYYSGNPEIDTDISGSGKVIKR